MNPLRWLAVKLSGYAAKPQRARGLSLVANWLANVLWVIDNTWTSLVKDTYGRNAVVYSCVRLLAQGVAEAPLKAYTEGNDDEKTELPRTHPLRQLIQRPNELMTEYEMLELITVHLAVRGLSVWWKERSNGGKPIALWPLRPDRVGPIYSTSNKVGERVIVGWAYTDPDTGRPIALPRRDCLTLNFPDPDGESGGIVEGLGPLSVLRYEVSADNRATDHVGALLANYAQPGVALKIQDSVDEDTANLIKAKFKQEFGGMRLGTPAVLDAGADIEKLGFSLRDLEFPDLRDNVEARICGVLGVPAILAGIHVGLKESNQRASTKELREFFTETTLSAYWRRYADQFTLELAIDYGENIVCEFDTSNVKALAGQFAEKLKPWAEAAAGGRVTVNEVRGQMGIDLLPPEVGDVLYIPQGVTVVAATPQAKAILDKQASEAMARQQELLAAQAPRQLPPGREEDEDEEADRLARKAHAIKDAIDPRDQAENRLRRALEVLFAKLAADIAAKIEAGEAIDDALLSAAFAQVIEPQLVEAATAEGIRIAAEIQVQFDPAIVNQAMAEWARSYNYELVRGLTDTTRKVLQNAVGKYAGTPGMTRGELEALLEPAFGKVRAEAIAVTEITRSYSQAMSHYQAELAADGISLTRIFHTSHDEKVCPKCSPWNGKPESEWGQKYPSGPPLHTFCRCSLSLRSVG